MHVVKSNIGTDQLDVQKTNVVSLDAALRMGGLRALDLWDLVIEVRLTEYQNEPKCWIRTWIYQTYIKFLRTHISLRKNHGCTFSKTTKL